MSVAFLFPGQGVDLAAVAAEWYARSSYARSLIELAAREAGVPPSQVLHAAGRALRDTKTFQPVLTAVSVAAWRELTALGMAADVVVGHSLGEIAGCVAAGAMEPEQGVVVAAARGASMAEAAARRPGGMAAVTARTLAEVESHIVAARLHGALAIAAHNAPDEWVLSGDHAALAALSPQLCPVMLETSGAWHSAAMAGAREAYRAALSNARVGRPVLPFVCNRTGALLSDDEDLVEMLTGQLTHRVEWATCMSTLAALGVTTIVTLGPAKALRSLARRNLGASMHVLAVDSPTDLEAAAEALVA